LNDKDIRRKLRLSLYARLLRQKFYFNRWFLAIQNTDDFLATNFHKLHEKQSLIIFTKKFRLVEISEFSRIYKAKFYGFVKI